MKNSDKNLSRKSDEIEVKICKNRFFPLHSSFFILRKHSFRCAKHNLWVAQSLCFVRWNITFHTMKPYLSHGETLPLANLFYVNRSITIEHPCNHLSANTLPKTSKNAVFSTESPFRCQHPLFFGVKIRSFLDKILKILCFKKDRVWRFVKRGSGNHLQDSPELRNALRWAVREQKVHHQAGIVNSHLLQL